MKVNLICILFLVLLICLSKSAISHPIQKQKSCSSSYVTGDDCKEFRGINIEALYLPHGATVPGKTEILNYGYLVSIDGISLFHTGDIDIQQFSFEEFRNYQLPENKIDISFIQHFYLTNDPTERKFVREGIGSRFIIPSHYHYTTPPLDTPIGEKELPGCGGVQKRIAKMDHAFYSITEHRSN